MWDAATDADIDHPYLLKKGVKPHGIRQQGDDLIIKIYDENETIQSLQRISPDGGKRFHPDGKIAGGFFTIGRPGALIYIGEGYSTCASVHSATGECVVVAFNAGNLLPVAQQILKAYPKATIIIAGDDDTVTKGNPGRTKASAAAQAIGAMVIFPTFQPTDGKPPSDFNDLMNLEGVEAVREQLRLTQGETPKVEGKEWPEPIPFGANVLPEIPLENFPPWFKDMIEGVAKSTETPTDLATMTGLATIATACQGTFEVEVESGYIEPVNIWCLAAMESGNRKTAVQCKMTGPLTKYDSHLAKETESERKRIASVRKTTEVKISHLRTKAAKCRDQEEYRVASQEIADLEETLPDVPASPQSWVQDITPEQLGTAMEAQGGALSLISDEGGILETFAGRYNGGVANIDLANQAHTGSPFRSARASRNDIDMQRPTLTIALSPQPGIIRGLIKKPALRETGFLARFLYVLPVSQLGHRTLEPVDLSPLVSNAYEAALHTLLQIDPPQDSDGNPVRYRLKLSTEASRERKEYAQSVEHDLREGGRFEHLKDWGGKLPGAAIRVAGLLHCAEHTTDGPQHHVISRATMETALEVMVVLEEHAIAAFELMKANPDVEDAQKILKWIQRHGQRVFSQRDCHNKLQGSFQRVGNLEPGLGVLVERSFIRALPKEANKTGRPSAKYEVHPSIELDIA